MTASLWASQADASTSKCSEIIAGLDGDLVWQASDLVMDLKPQRDSKFILVNDGAFLKGLSVFDGRVRWDFRFSEYFPKTQMPFVVRAGNRVYLVGVKKMVELNAETGDFVASHQVPFIQRPLPHDIVMGMTFPHRGHATGEGMRNASELLEQAATDRSFYVLDDWFLIVFEEGIRFLNRKGGAWKEKALAGFIGAAHSGRVEPHIFPDGDQFVTSYPGAPGKNAKLEAFRFNYPEATFLREWSLELKHRFEKTDYQFTSNSELVFAVTYVPTSREDGLLSKRMIAIDRNLGELVWEKPISSLTWQNHHLQVQGDHLLYVMEDWVIAVKASTGEKVWAFQVADNSPVKNNLQIQPLDDKTVLAQRGEKAFLLRASDGRLEADLKLLSPSNRAPLFTLHALGSRGLLLHSSEGTAQDKLSYIRVR